MGKKQADIVADASTSCSVCSYVVEVAEICRIDGTVEGGFSVPCSCGKAADMVVDELLDELSREVLTEEFPFYSLKWNIRKVGE